MNAHRQPTAGCSAASQGRQPFEPRVYRRRDRLSRAWRPRSPSISRGSECRSFGARYWSGAREVPQATALLCGASRKDVTRLSGLLNSQRATPLSCSSWVRQRHQSSQLAPAESHCGLSQTASNRISLSSFDSEVKQRLEAVGVRTMFVMRKR